MICLDSGVTGVSPISSKFGRPLWRDERLVDVDTIHGGVRTRRWVAAFLR